MPDKYGKNLNVSSSRPSMILRINILKLNSLSEK